MAIDVTKRKITKINREVSRLTAKVIKNSGVGTAEIDFIHVVRKNPGITQKRLGDILSADKGAVARQAVNLEKKGYIIRRQNPRDGRSQVLYATEKADKLKDLKARTEALFYGWLEEDLTRREKQRLESIIDKMYTKCREESRNNFKNFLAQTEELDKGDVDI